MIATKQKLAFADDKGKFEKINRKAPNEAENDLSIAMRPGQILLEKTKLSNRPITTVPRRYVCCIFCDQADDEFLVFRGENICSDCREELKNLLEEIA